MRKDPTLAALQTHIRQEWLAELSGEETSLKHFIPSELIYGYLIKDKRVSDAHNNLSGIQASFELVCEFRVRSILFRRFG